MYRHVSGDQAELVLVHPDGTDTHAILSMSASRHGSSTGDQLLRDAEPLKDQLGGLHRPLLATAPGSPSLR